MASRSASRSNSKSSATWCTSTILNVTFDDKYIEAIGPRSLDVARACSSGFSASIRSRWKDFSWIRSARGRPPTAAARESLDFEKKIWDDFWLIANDPKRAAEMGIRAAHGEAVSMRVRPGKTYEIDLRYRRHDDSADRSRRRPVSDVRVPSTGRDMLTP